jgi:hypothetical protein
LGGIDDAYALVVESAEFLFGMDPKSPVPYLVCSGLRLGETRMQGPSPQPGFAVGPAAGDKAIAPIAGQQGRVAPIAARIPADSWPANAPERGWICIDTSGAPDRKPELEAISDAVVGTVKSLLAVRPELALLDA